MEKFTAEQNFQLAQAIDWIDTFAEEIFDIDDFSSTDKTSKGRDSMPNNKGSLRKKRPLRKRQSGSLPV